MKKIKKNDQTSRKKCRKTCERWSYTRKSVENQHKIGLKKTIKTSKKWIKFIKNYEKAIKCEKIG